MNNAMNKTALVWVLRVFLVMLTIVAFVATSLPTATAQDPEDAGAGASAASQAEEVTSENSTPAVAEQRDDVPAPAPAAEQPTSQPSTPVEEAPTPSAAPEGEKEENPADENGPMLDGMDQKVDDSGQMRARSMAAETRAGQPDWLTPALDNPELPDKCGMKIALVFDLSGSIGKDGLDASKAAANAIVDGLKGTPSEIGLFNFATNAPAVSSATQNPPLSVADGTNVPILTNKINSLVIGNPSGTNWEGGLEQVPIGVYDVIYFVTDGAPTTNENRTANDYGSRTHVADIDDAIKAANALKGKTRIVPVFVGANSTYYVYDNDNRYRNKTRSSKDMVADVSDSFASIPVSNYSNLVSDLKDKILAPCKGTLNIVKTIVDENGDKIENGVVSGWDFTATAESNVLVGSNDALESEQTKATDGEGHTTFRIKSDKNQTLTVSETQKEGFNLRKQTDGKNARCFLAKEGQEPEQVIVSNDGDAGIRVTVPTINAVPGTVTCYVDNTPMPKASIKKTAANGQHIGEAVQVNPDNTAELTYKITVDNASVNYKAVAVEPKEIVRIPVGVEANGNATVTFESEEGVTVTGGIGSIAKGDLTSGKEVTLADKIELEKGKSQVITVKIPVKVTDTSDEAWARLEVCEGDSATVSAKGVPNSTDMESDVDKNDNNACIPLTKPKASTLVIKKVDAADETKPLNDSKFQLFGSDAAGNIDLTKPITGEGAGNDVLGENLLPGTYYLVETKSPSGYSLLPKPVKLIVKGTADGYTIELGNPADGGLISVGNDTSGDQPDKFRLVVTVADVETGSLPKTGGFGTGGYALVWMTLVGAAAFLARRQLKA